MTELALPRRIVSLVPSLSESLVDLGLRDQLVGCTTFCVEPPDLHRTARPVGGTKDFDIETIIGLRPTHVLANREENPKEAIEGLQRHCRVLVTYPRAPADVPGMLRAVGDFLGEGAAFRPAALELEALLGRPLPTSRRRRFLYFIWREPYMVAGPDTYISKLLECFGWRNAYEGSERYPVLAPSQMRALNVERCLLSSEPYPFRKRDAVRLREEWPECPGIFKIDGRLMSWHGTTTAKAWRYLQSLEEGRGLSSL